MFPLVVVAAFLLVQAAAIVVPTRAQAAPTISVATTGTMSFFGNPSATKTVSFNAGTGTGRVLVVVVASDSRTNKMNSVSYGSSLTPMTQAVDRLAGGTAVARVQVFYLVNPESGTNNVNFTASFPDDYGYIIAYVSGADTSDPIGTINPNSASSGSTLSVSNTPEASDSLIVAGFASDSTTAFTPSGGSTEVGDLLASSVRTGLYTKVAPTAGAATSVAASGGSLGWAAGAIEIKLPVDMPEVSVVATDENAEEPSYQYDYSGDPGVFTFSRTGSTAASLEVNFGRDGTAYYTDDYNFDNESTCSGVNGDGLTIPAGQASCTLVIMPLDDEDSGEPTQTVEISIEGGQYDYGANTTDTVYIANYEPTAPGEGYTVAAPGFASMLLYDADTVPAGSVTGFTHTPLRVRAGQSATLSWTISGMTSCSISPGIGGVTPGDGTHSSTTPAITARTTYTLSCSDGTGPLPPWTTTVGIVPSFIEQ